MKQCQDKECLTSDSCKTPLIPCQSVLKESGSEFFCTKFCEHKGKHHSCGMEYREWEKK